MDEGEAGITTCFARHYGPGERKPYKKRAALRGGGWGAGAGSGLLWVGGLGAPPGAGGRVGFRGIPFEDGMRDHGCGRKHQINSTSPGIPVAR